MGNGIGLFVPEIDTTPSALGPSSPGLTTPMFTTPRLALDVFALRRISLGVAAVYFRSSAHYEEDAPNAPVPEEVVRAVVVAPRVGYVFSATRLLAVWPRVGVTYVWMRATSSRAATYTDTTAYSLYGLTLEAPLAIRAAPHVLVTVGPTLDHGFAGRVAHGGATLSANIPNQRTRETDVGVSAGVAASF
jgi:hypothetical protein